MDLRGDSHDQIFMKGSARTTEEDGLKGGQARSLEDVI